MLMILCLDFGKERVQIGASRLGREMRHDGHQLEDLIGSESRLQHLEIAAVNVISVVRRNDRVLHRGGAVGFTARAERFFGIGDNLSRDNRHLRRRESREKNESPESLNWVACL